MKRRLSVLALVWCIGFWVIGCGGTAKSVKYQGDDPAAKIARAYGIENFDDLEAIRYTFNVLINGKTIQRSWVWEPEARRVTYKGNGPDGEAMEATYDRGKPDSEKFDGKIDAWFINDQYWLLFPFHLKWDQGIAISEDGIQPLPIGAGSANRITVSYPPDKGYTPGDAYKLYYGPDYLIKQWTYHKGGVQKPTRVATWEQHASVGPVTISLSHRGEDESFKLWFTDVAARPKGSQAWIPALIY